MAEGWPIHCPRDVILSRGAACALWHSFSSPKKNSASSLLLWWKNSCCLPCCLSDLGGTRWAWRICWPCYANTYAWHVMAMLICLHAIVPYVHYNRWRCFSPACNSIKQMLFGYCCCISCLLMQTVVKRKNYKSISHCYYSNTFRWSLMCVVGFGKSTSFDCFLFFSPNFTW